jgi:hypothetical protein
MKRSTLSTAANVLYGHHALSLAYPAMVIFLVSSLRLLWAYSYNLCIQLPETRGSNLVQ